MIILEHMSPQGLYHIFIYMMNKESTWVLNVSYIIREHKALDL